MAFGNKKPTLGMNLNRVSAIAGSTAVASADVGAVTSTRRVSVEPDMSRMRKCSIDETDEERKARLAAKTMNFGATIIIRLIILAAAGFYAWGEYQGTGKVDNGVGFGIFVVVADLGRVVMKALQPGSK